MNESQKNFGVAPDYNGPLFIEIPTRYVMKDSGMVDELNAVTKRIIHNFDKPGVTIWELNDFSAALKTVLKLQEKKYPFRLTGENEVLFMQVDE